MHDPVQNNYKKETQNDQATQIAFMWSLSGYFQELCHTATDCSIISNALVAKDVLQHDSLDFFTYPIDA